MKRLIVHIILVLVVFWTVSTRPVSAAPPACPNSFFLDGVALQICAPFIGASPFVTADPSNAIQIAYSADPSLPDQVFSITAIPVGAGSSSENLPVLDASTSLETVQAQIRAVRIQQGGQPQAGPSASLFGQSVASIVSQVSLPGALSDQLTQVTEWVWKAGNRFWILRASQKLASAGTAGRAGSTQGQPAPAAGLVLASPDLTPSSTSLNAQPAMPRSGQMGQSATAANLPVPAWWSKTPCDFDYYHNHAGNYYSFPLGTSFRGMDACGPRHAFGEGPDVAVVFFPGAIGQYEWECVELSMRFLYLAYGIKPYIANGNQVVAHYPGTLLDKINNNTRGVAPQPGDVLSYCATCAVGHTSVVMASSVDSSGNGSVTVIEENNSYYGQSVLNVSNWTVAGNAGPVLGWLRPHSAQSPPLNNHTFFPIVRR